MPMMAMGCGNSWLMLERKSDFARLAFLPTCLAFFELRPPRVILGHVAENHEDGSDHLTSGVRMGAQLSAMAHSRRSGPASTVWLQAMHDAPGARVSFTGMREGRRVSWLMMRNTSSTEAPGLTAWVRPVNLGFR